VSSPSSLSSTVRKGKLNGRKRKKEISKGPGMVSDLCSPLGEKELLSFLLEGGRQKSKKAQQSRIC